MMMELVPFASNMESHFKNKYLQYEYQKLIWLLLIFK